MRKIKPKESESEFGEINGVRFFQNKENQKKEKEGESLEKDLGSLHSFPEINQKIKGKLNSVECSISEAGGLTDPRLGLNPLRLPPGVTYDPHSGTWHLTTLSRTWYYKKGLYKE